MLLSEDSLPRIHGGKSTEIQTLIWIVHRLPRIPGGKSGQKGDKGDQGDSLPRIHGGKSHEGNQI